MTALLPGDVLGQGPGSRVGVTAGWNHNEQLWKPEAETEAVGGLVLGAFALAPTPLEPLSVLVEGLYTQRGGDVQTDVLGSIPGGVRADYLTFTLHARLSGHFGRASVHTSGGMTLDQLLRVNVDPSLTTVLERESPTVFGVSAAVGFGLRITEGVDVEVEARIVEGLSDAHSGNFRSFRNRSKEVVVRLGVPLPGR